MAAPQESKMKNNDLKIGIILDLEEAAKHLAVCV